MEWPGRHNYELNSATILLDAYRLLTIFMADRSISERAVDRRDPLAGLRDRFVEEEFIHLLIWTAIVNRTQHDHMNGPRNDRDELNFHPVEIVCGQWLPDITNCVQEPLIFREACNKIIHAVTINADTLEDSGLAFEVLPFIVVLKGEHQKKCGKHA